MYGMVLMVAVTGSGDAASFGKHKNGCTGYAAPSYGCTGYTGGGCTGYAAPVMAAPMGCTGYAASSYGCSGSCSGGGFLGKHRSNGCSGGGFLGKHKHGCTGYTTGYGCTGYTGYGCTGYTAPSCCCGGAPVISGGAGCYGSMPGGQVIIGGTPAVTPGTTTVPMPMGGTTGGTTTTPKKM